MDDQSYFQRRADVEMRRARTATVPAVARAHSELAQAYLGKLAVVELPARETR